MLAYFSRGLTIEMTLAQAENASHQGQCDEDVKALLRAPKIKRQLAKIDDATLIAELKEYGAWDDEELQDRTANEQRVIWLAACDIKEEAQERRRAKP